MSDGTVRPRLILHEGDVMPPTLSNESLTELQGIIEKAREMGANVTHYFERDQIVVDLNIDPTTRRIVLWNLMGGVPAADGYRVVENMKRITQAATVPKRLWQ